MGYKVRFGYFLIKALAREIEIVCLEEGSIKINMKVKNLDKVMRFLKSNMVVRCVELLDIVGIDYLGRKNRFELLYNILSIESQCRIFVRVQVLEKESILSLTNVYSSAGWLEREIWDMFGIYFLENKDLRRILTDYGFEGYPLRKDFPLSGYKEVRYNEELKKIVNEPLEVNQEYRYYDFTMPWDLEGKN